MKKLDLLVFLKTWFASVCFPDKNVESLVIMIYDSTKCYKIMSNIFVYIPKSIPSQVPWGQDSLCRPAGLNQNILPDQSNSVQIS